MKNMTQRMIRKLTTHPPTHIYDFEYTYLVALL